VKEQWEDWASEFRFAAIEYETLGYPLKAGQLGVGQVR
jgi:hypothetical protein